MLERLDPYIKEKKPSPYLLEYVHSLYVGAIYLVVGCVLVVLMSIIVGIIEFLPILIGMVPILMIATLLYYFLIEDRAGWLYWLDKRKGQVESIQGKIWDVKEEFLLSLSQYSINGIDANKTYLFYDEELSASRALLYCLQPGEEVFPRGEFDTDTRTLETKSGKKLKYVRTVFTVLKVEVFERFMEIYPDMKAELVYWKWSKVLIEFRPMEGVEYPPEALECLAAMNAMYP